MDVAINSLGYNNLLYIATVFAELEAINNNLFTVLLIEEPEAHLHPQIQSKLIKYLQKLSDEKKNLQIILTTHSAVLASSVSVDTIVHVMGTSTGIMVKKMLDFKFDERIKNYLNRWMDITKSTLLFSKGIILVEGICEAMLLPVFAPLVLKEYNDKNQKKLPNTLEEAGVTVAAYDEVGNRNLSKLIDGKNFRVSNGNGKVLIGEFNEKKKNKIPITTIHKSKGCTFDSTLVISSKNAKSTGGHWKEHWLNGTGESKRIGYVASTRARHLLVWGVPKLKRSDKDLIGSYGFINAEKLL